ncbi:hypothetical protein ACJX0J_021180, partial [Zea mays]
GRREPQPVHAGGRRRALRAASVPHLLPQLRAALRHAGRRGGHAHAQVRDGRHAGGHPAVARHSGSRRAAAGARPGQEPRAREVRPQLHPDRALRRRAAWQGPRRRTPRPRATGRLRTGIRDDGGRARAVHVPGVRQGAGARQAGVVRHSGAQRGAQGGGPGHGPLPRPQPPRRDLHPGPADHERVPERPGGHREDDRRPRLAPHRRHRLRRRRRRGLHRRPRQGAHQVQGLPGAAGRARGSARRPPVHRRRGRRPAKGRSRRRGPRRLRGPRRRRRHRGGRHQGVHLQA